MRRRMIISIAIVLLLLVAWGFYLYNKPHTDVSNIPASVSISAQELYHQFEQDETSANKKYLDKVIEVKGVVNEVQQSDTTLNILLSGGNGMGGINCSIAEKNPSGNIHKNEMMTIKGRCTGFLLDVSLVDCVIEK